MFLYSLSHSDVKLPKYKVLPSHIDLFEQIVVEFCTKDCKENVLQASKNCREPWRTERGGQKKSPDFSKNQFDLNVNSRKDHILKPFILKVIENQSWLFEKKYAYFS